MTTPDLTAAQRERARELGPLLGAVDNTDVWQEPDGTSVETARAYFGVSDPIAEVTDQIQLAEHAGFVTAVPLTLGPGSRWELTDTGRAALNLYRNPEETSA